MSIASEITRLQGAKSDLKDAIEGKGVTVPSATKLDGYADLVDAISQGGGTLGTKTITSNGTYNASSDGYDGYSQVTAAVPASAVDQGMKVINSNGQHDVVGYAVAAVVVPNTYTSSDEGKVVSNGALVAQTSDTVTANDTYDTTLINSLTVNVSGGGSIDHEHGTYTPTERTQSITVTTVGDYNNFAIFAGEGFDWEFGTAALIIDVFPDVYGVGTNNGGTSANALGTAGSLTKSGKTFTYTSSTTGPSARMLQAGVTYHWLAW